VRKEIQASSNIIELVDFHRSVNSLADLTPRDWNHRTFMPELSATYCYSLLKAKARSVDFDPEQYLPRECFTNNKVVLSYHLKSMIGLLQLELSSAEFVKLWQRFDLNNLGGVQTKVFLRLLGYRPNELNELATSIEAVRYKKSRVLSNNLARRLLHRQDNMKKRTFSSHALTGASFGNFNDMSGSEDQNEEKNDDERPAAEGLPSARNVIEAIKEENAAIVEKPEVTVPATADLESPEQSSVKNDRQSARGENRRRDLKSASEYKFGIVNEPVASAGGAPNSGVDMKIKTLVRALKSARKFGPSQDLVSFLNAKLNEGYITFRTAFEYVDQERTNHLLVDEFKVVLEEFNVEMDEITYQKFLRKYKTCV
jgi:Ca2+-binding EF-hand superfamily protein